MIKLKLATICDNAFTDQNGQLTIVQTFNQIFIAKVGIPQPRLTIAVTYQLNNELPNPKFTGNFDAKILDPSGKIIAPISVPKNGIKEGETEMNFIAYFVNLPLNYFGEYKIIVSFLDISNDLTFTVKPIPSTSSHAES
ncbi:MAG: hypothetical protein WAV41_02835 [Microgenomates group bacterium]